MTAILAALAVAFSFDASVAAETVEAKAVRTVSEAAALARACPLVEMDRKVIALALARAGVKVGPLMPAIQAQRAEHALKLSLVDPRKACMLARALYGARGTSAAGFLSDRKK